MPTFRSTANTWNESAIWGSAVAITVPSSCSMNIAPATSRAIIRDWRCIPRIVIDACREADLTYRSGGVCPSRRAVLQALMTLIQIQSGLAELGRWAEKALLVAGGVLLCVMASSVFFEVVMRYL